MSINRPVKTTMNLVAELRELSADEKWWALCWLAGAAPEHVQEASEEAKRVLRGRVET